jgi:hypothetical protein
MRLAEGIENHTLTGNKRIELWNILNFVHSERLSPHGSNLLLQSSEWVRYLGKNVTGIDNFAIRFNGNIYMAKGELNSGQY